MRELDEVLTFLEEKLGDLDPSCMKPCAGIRLNAVSNIYKKTSDERARALILAASDKFVAADAIVMDELTSMEYTAPLTVLFDAYRITGEDRYKDTIVKLEKSDMYTGLAFDMMYETTFGGKERYHAITVEFAKLYEKMNKTEMGKAMFMEALIDTIEAINQPVYELYRSLVDLFRSNVGNCLTNGEYAFANDKANLVLAYAIKKACDMKVLLAEKYEEAAVKVVERTNELSCAYALASTVCK